MRKGLALIATAMAPIVVPPAPAEVDDLTGNGAIALERFVDGFGTDDDADPTGSPQGSTIAPASGQDDELYLVGAASTNQSIPHALHRQLDRLAGWGRITATERGPPSVSRTHQLRTAI